MDYAVFGVMPILIFSPGFSGLFDAFKMMLDKFYKTLYDFIHNQQLSLRLSQFAFSVVENILAVVFLNGRFFCGNIFL